MINLESEFSPRINPADTSYPFGSIKDNSSPGANDGTPLSAVWGNDWEGFAQAAMTEAGITPSGLPDTAQDSQLLDAVKAVTSGALRSELSNYSQYTFSTVAKMQTGETTGGLIVTLKAGDVCHTGATKWRITSSVTGIAIAGGLYADPISAIHTSSFGLPSGGDDLAALHAILNLAGEIVFDNYSDILVSDTVKYVSDSNIRFVGSGFIKLTQSSSVGAVFVAMGTSDLPVENCQIFNPRVDGGNFGWPTGAAYGENGIGGTKCRNIKVHGGVVKNCRRGLNAPVGTGGKAIQFEIGVDDIFVDGLTATDCTIVCETGGIEDVTSPYQFRRYKGVNYKNLRAYNCERIVSLSQANSPPSEFASVGSAVIDGILAYNCGREGVVGTEKNFGAIVIDRASNASIKNVVLYNDSTYGTLGALIRHQRGTNIEIDVTFVGDADALVLHDVGSTGFGTTGVCQDNSYKIKHDGTAGYAISGSAGLTALLKENIYDIELGALTSGIAHSNIAFTTLMVHVISADKSQRMFGRVPDIIATYGNQFPTYGNNAFAGTTDVNGVYFTASGTARVITSRVGTTETLRMQYAGSNRLELKSTGLSVFGISTYADNTTAKAGGLIAGDMYKTATGQLMVCY